MATDVGLAQKVSCCYNCVHFKLIKSHGLCQLHGEQLYNATSHWCADHEKTQLVKCNECGGEYRNLGLHVKVHGMNAAEYKAKYGLNRHTSLSAPITQKMVGESVSEERREMLRDRMKNIDRSSIHTKGMTIRAEGLRNFRNKKVSGETRRRMSEAQKGKSKGRGVPKSEQHRAKISSALKKYIGQRGRKIVRNEKGQIVTYQRER